MKTGLAYFLLAAVIGFLIGGISGALAGITIAGVVLALAGELV